MGPDDSGHSGRELTIRRVKSIFTWNTLSNYVKKVVSACKVCQASKNETVASPGLLQSFPVPGEVWLDISMDFITGLPKSGGKNVILVVSDMLGKYVHFMSLGHPIQSYKLLKHT